MRTVFMLILGAVLLLAAEAIGCYVYFSRGSFSASQRPPWLEEELVEGARELAMPRDARARTNPFPFDAPAMNEARDHYAEHCAACHGVDGKGKTVIGRNSYPPAPDLTTSDSQGMSDGEIYYIIYNGVRFSGMPAWGKSHSEKENWHLVSFIRRLPKLSAEELEQIRKAAPELATGEGEQHHSPGAGQSTGPAARQPAAEPGKAKPHEHKHDH